jgi:hypothetical protein
MSGGHIGELIWSFHLRGDWVLPGCLIKRKIEEKESKGRSRIFIFVILTENCIRLWIGFSAAACLVELRF